MKQQTLNRDDSSKICFDQIISRLDESQYNAVFHRHGPALIVAGPGSGKTTVILCRVWYLISQCHVPPHKILVLTFTKAAASSLQTRFIALSNKETHSVSFGTFHSVFYQILRQYTSYKDSNIITTKEKYEILKELGIAEEMLCRDVLHAIGAILNNPYADVMTFLPPQMTELSFQKLLQEYLAKLKQEQLIDFDQMASLTLQLVKENSRILLALQSQYPFILVDEFQDTNPIQYELLKVWSSQTRQLFVVGDDDQSIYSFRGSYPAIMRQLEADYEDVKTYYLSTNYRCEANIVKVTNRLIAQNQNRLSKKIVAHTSELGEIRYRCFETAKEEYEFVAERLKELSLNFSLEDMAVIGRTNRQIEQLKVTLKREGVLYSEEKSTEKEKTTLAAKCLIDIIQYILGEKPAGHIWRLITKDKHRKASFWRDKHAKLLMSHLLYHSELLEYLKGKGDMEENERELKQLYAESTQYKDLRLFLEYLKTRKIEQKTGQNGVQLLTMHGAKGLEFSYVALIDINEGIVPGKQCVNQEQIEEERRMLYVGMTRAKKILDVCYLKGTKEHPRLASRFLNPLLGRESD